MPNWKKVIVSGSDADLKNLSAEHYNLVPTGSGSVPALSYSVPFVTSGSVSSSIFIDNQAKIQWFPAGELEVTGNIGATGFITGSGVNAANNAVIGGHLTSSLAKITNLPEGTTETRIVVSNTSGNLKYRTNLSLQGATGEKGAQGITGPQGDVGAQGETGQKGQTGDTGAQGATGSQGNKGQKGEVGAQGDKGDTGSTGAQGPTGQKGTTGDDGDQGAQGTTGATGPQGATGQKGEVGAQGNQGAQGATGPQGNQGNQGVQGTDGEKGATGPQGNQGNQGIQGTTGQKGQKGEVGDEGATGAQGTTGTTGPQGNTGPQGATGQKGQKGEIGAQGTDGEKGATGPQGNKGDTGATGPQGNQGVQGATGPQGPAGTLTDFTQDGTSAVARNVYTKLKEVFSVKDFGATGNGSTDDYSAITAAIAASAGKTLIFPKGTYSVSQTIIFDKSDTIIRGEGDVTITMPASTHRSWSVANVGKSTVGTANAISPVERVLIENITFDFNDDRRDSVSGTQSSQDDAYKKNACTIANAKYITMRNCRFLDGFRHCLDITTPIKKNVDSLTTQQKWLQMPVLPNISGTEVFGAQYITIENCYFKGAGDDNLTTHYCSDVLITGCRSESPYGGYSDTGGGNNNGFEIDDGSRNIILTNSVAIKCMSGIEVKAHEYFPAPYNIMIDACRIINCSEPIEIHHTGWEGPITGTGTNAFHHLFNDTSGTVTLGAGTDQEVVCTDGISPMARNICVSNIQIIAPATFSYYTRDSSNYFTAATKNPERCFEVGNYDGVLVSNITFNDGRNDTALSDVDGYVQASAFGASGPGSTGDVGLIHLHNGCRNVSFSNIQVTGFGGSSPLTGVVFKIVASCFDAINCSNLTVVDGPEKIVSATGSTAEYFGAFRGVQIRSATTRTGPALDSTNDNLRFEQPDIRGYTNTVNVNELVLEKSTSTPGSGRGKGSVHVNKNTGVLRTKSTGRSSNDWQSLGALAWARYSGSAQLIRQSNNIASIVRNSTGNYTVTLDSNLEFASSNDFCAVATSSQPMTKVGSATVSSNQASFTVETIKSDGTNGNSGFINIVVYGITSN